MDKELQELEYELHSCRRDLDHSWDEVYSYRSQLDSLLYELDEGERQHAYMEHIHAKYPAVAEAYRNYCILFELAKETEQTPDVAKAV